MRAPTQYIRAHEEVKMNIFEKVQWNNATATYGILIDLLNAQKAVYAGVQRRSAVTLRLRGT